ncbi:GNAT family N-acetyltransferase [Mesorhizobium sp. B2-6-5]|uniref:GNAT family N-acetyltransferase n=1 Tax=Mesorhizobium sp. B2-6-5 TaxID=2589912 RepID=UPI0032B20398
MYGDALHLVAIDGGDVVGTLRIVFLPEHAKFGRVAVLPHARGKGVAARMNGISAVTGRNSFLSHRTSGQHRVLREACFVAYGDEFEEAGMPHRAMKTY